LKTGKQGQEQKKAKKGGEKKKFLHRGNYGDCGIKTRENNDESSIYGRGCKWGSETRRIKGVGGDHAERVQGGGKKKLNGTGEISEPREKRYKGGLIYNRGGVGEKKTEKSGAAGERS